MRELMTSNSDLVSIITPFKNSIIYFKETYNSVISQSYSNFEWFIIDDGSDIEQYSALEEICKDPRVKILSNTNAPGAGGARNTAFNYISGKYITFIDSDDVWQYNFIMNSLCFLNERKVNSCFSGYNRYLENEKKFMSPFIPSKVVTSDTILKGCDISCLTFFGLSQYINEDVRFGTYRARNDLYFFYHYLIQSGSSYPNGMTLATYRLGKKSISSNKIRLIKYQYLVNRDVANNGILKSIMNVAVWSFYGLVKYR